MVTKRELLAEGSCGILPEAAQSPEHFCRIYSSSERLIIIERAHMNSGVIESDLLCSPPRFDHLHVSTSHDRGGLPGRDYVVYCSHLHSAGHGSSYSVGGSMTPTGSPPLGIGPLQHQPYILRGLRDQPTLTKAYGQAGSQVGTSGCFLFLLAYKCWLHRTSWVDGYWHVVCTLFSMALSGLRCRKALVRTGRANSVVF